MVFDQFSNLDSKYYTDPLAFNPRRWQVQDMPTPLRTKTQN